jgi:hypothetical protein
MEIDNATKESLFQKCATRGRIRACVRVICLVLILALAGSVANAVSATDPVGPGAKIIPSERDALQSTYNLLAQANHNYRGHRLRAKKRIRQAGALLGLDLQGEGTGGEDQTDSDAALQQAASLLEQVRAGLPEDESPAMLDNLDNAIKQIGAALKVRAKMKNDADDADESEEAEGPGSAVVPAKVSAAVNTTTPAVPSQTPAGQTADPATGIAPLVARLVKQDGGILALTWNAAPGQRYQVQYMTGYNSNLMGSGWQNLGDLVTAGSNSVTVPVDAGTDSQRFYRVVLLQ